VPRCGALSLLQKPRTTGGDSEDFAPGLTRNFCDLVRGGGGGGDGAAPPSARSKFQ
jgi:hypothetical protein